MYWILPKICPPYTKQRLYGSHGPNIFKAIEVMRAKEKEAIVKAIAKEKEGDVKVVEKLKDMGSIDI